MADVLNYGIGAPDAYMPDTVALSLQRKLAPLQVQQAQLQNQVVTQQIAQGQEKQRRERMFQDALPAAISGGAREVSNLLLQFPEFGENIKRSWELRDKASQQADLRQMSEVYSLANAGNFEGAAKSIRARIEADKAAGIPPDEYDQAILDGLSGTPEQQRQAVGMIGLGLSAITGPEKFAATFEKLNEGRGLKSAGPGSYVFDNDGNVRIKVPFAPRPVTVGDNTTVFEYDPNNPGGGDQSGGGSGQLTVDGVARHIVAQESSGNYSAVNSSTGAMGAYQIMPDTGKALAGQLGIAWNPDLMTSSTPTGKAYQDKIGRAAIKEAIDNSGGDPTTFASYYYGGSDRSKWGPKTRQYAQEVAARLNGSGGSGGGLREIGRGVPRPGYKTLTPQEVAAIPNLDPSKAYQRSPDGQITAIGGGANGSNERKAETDLRKEFNSLPEVKDFKDVRTNFEQVRALGTRPSPTPQDDIALIFSYMKMLDPGSVVREGEFATAQNAAGVPDQIRNLWNRAKDGARLNSQQRSNMVSAAERVYRSRRDLYNAKAREYRGYANDYGFEGTRIAPIYNDAPRQGARTGRTQPPSTAPSAGGFRIIGVRPKQ